MDEQMKEILSGIDEIRDSIRKINDSVKMMKEVRQLVGPVGISMPDGTLLTSSIFGIKYLIDPNDLIMAPQMIIYRQWEADVSQALVRLISQMEAKIFVDVGANFGYFTCLAASRMGSYGGSRVFAFEPNPRLFSLLQKNLFMNWSSAPAVVRDVAISDQSGAVELYIPKERGANATLSSTAADAGAVESVLVRASRLDEEIPEDIIVDILKIDIEGYEYYALKGAVELIGRSPQIKVIMEWSRDQMLSAGTQPNDMISLMKSYHLIPFSIETENFDKELALIWDEVESMSYANLILTRLS